MRITEMLENVRSRYDQILQSEADVLVQQVGNYRSRLIKIAAQYVGIKVTPRPVTIPVIFNRRMLKG